MSCNRAGVLANNAELQQRVLMLHDAAMMCKPIGRVVGLSGPTVSQFLRSKGRSLNRQPGRSIDLVDTANARCSRCLCIKAISEWPLHTKGGKSAHLSYCRECYNARLKKYDNSTLRNKLKKKYVQLCARQRREGKLFNVTFEQFAALWDSQRGKCFYTDTDLSIVVGNGKKANSLSVDRVRPDDGYEFENVVLAANRINGMKGDASLTEMRRWMPEWHERIITRHYWDANPEGKSADLRTAK